METCPVGVGNSPDEEVEQAQGQWPLDANPKEGRGSFLSPITLVSEAQTVTSPLQPIPYYCSSSRGPFS